MMALELAYGVGALLLLAALIYGVMQSQRRNKANDPITAEATEQLYKDPDGYAAGKEEDLRSKVK